MSSSTHLLTGRRVAITRAVEQASSLRERLLALGAEVVELPLIRVSGEIDKHNLAECMLELGGYDWIVFTSANGVRFFFEQFFKLFDDIRSLGLLRMACVGDATAKAVQALHLRVECQSKKATAEALAEELIATGSLDNAKVLVITGNLNRDTLVQKLEAARAIVDRLQVYKTEHEDLSADPAAEAFRQKGADAILFASSSAVDAYLAQGEFLRLEVSAKVPLLGSIGPQTSASIHAGGLKLGFEARNSSADGLIEALCKVLTEESSRSPKNRNPRK